MNNYVISIDRWTISNSSLTYKNTIKIEGDYQYSQYSPFIQPMTQTTNKEFRDAAFDIEDFTSKYIF